LKKVFGTTLRGVEPSRTSENAERGADSARKAKNFLVGKKRGRLKIRTSGAPNRDIGYKKGKGGQKKRKALSKLKNEKKVTHSLGVGAGIIEL